MANTEIEFTPLQVDYAGFIRMLANSRILFTSDGHWDNLAALAVMRLLDNEEDRVRWYNDFDSWIPGLNVKFSFVTWRVVAQLSVYTQEIRDRAIRTNQLWRGVGIVEYNPFSDPDLAIAGTNPAARMRRVGYCLNNFMLYFFDLDHDGAPGLPAEFRFQLDVEPLMVGDQIIDELSRPFRFFLQRSTQEERPVRIMVKGPLDDEYMLVPNANNDQLLAWFRNHKWH